MVSVSSILVCTASSQSVCCIRSCAVLGPGCSSSSASSGVLGCAGCGVVSSSLSGKDDDAGLIEAGLPVGVAGRLSVAGTLSVAVELLVGGVVFSSLGGRGRNCLRDSNVRGFQGMMTGKLAC